MTSWDECHCVGPYYYFQPFSADEKYLVFVSDRTGQWELYRLNNETAEATQFTHYADSELPAAYVSAFNFHPNGREVFYLDGRSVWATDIETLETREVVRSPRGWKGDYNGPCFSPDGSQLFTCLQDADDYVNFVVCAANSEAGDDKFEVIYRWPYPTGEESRVDIDHLHAAPTKEQILTFNPNPDRQNDPRASREERARYWKIDVATGQAEPFLVMPPGFRATHGFWGTLASGEPRLFFHKKTVPGWTPTALASVNSCGEDLQEHFVSDTLRLGHSEISPDGKTLVTDVVNPHNNQMIAVDMETGASEILCWPDSSVEQSADGIQYGHVHLLFSPGGRKILYTSDQSGKAAVYILPLESA